ncbi:MAG TPA: hypothetical protein VMM13_07755, partial [Euzebya sp.]|nr:hypothetical protein [Euzebya sp.]
PTTGQRPIRGAYDLQAGVVEVRPLRFTDILDGSFSLFRATMGAMVAMVLAIMVPLQLLSAFLRREALSFGFSGLLDDRATADLLLGEAGVSPALVLTGVSQVLVVPVLGGALVLVAGRRYLGQQVDLRQVLSQTGRKAGWLVLAYLATWALRLLPLILVAAAVATGSAVGLAISVVLTGVVVVAMTPLFVLVTPAIMLEPRQPVQAFLHALRLVRGAYWRTLGVMIGTTLVFNLLALLLAGLPNVIGLIGGFGFAWVLVALGSILAQLIVAPLTAASMVLLHADLRIRQEGLDFDILVQRMRSRAAA